MTTTHITPPLLLRFVSDELLDGESIGPADNLLADGAVDSLGMMRLVAFIQAQADMVIPAEDLTIENFRTVDAICTYLARQA